jgi:ketosteroid isomerase-like protein
MTPEAAQAFTQEWIDGWNSHDADRILDHYADDIVFLSPIAHARVGNGRVEGIAALASYWRGALKAIPELRFELQQVLVGHNCLTIIYRNHLNGLVAETVEFSPASKVIRSCACYA